MSTYNGTGRRAPNVSQYLHNLNTAPTAQELADQQQALDLTAAGDLDFLTNTEFFDFDQFNPNVPVFPADNIVDNRNGQQFAFDQFNAFSQTAVNSPTTTASPHDALHGIYPTQPHHFSASPVVGDKRKASVSMPAVEHLEESSRVAAEEDKRRRNTAASARFRVKKKQREQALEKQTKEMSDKVSALENKVSQLEQENKWLKGLITEKSDGKALDIALEARLKKETDERSTGNRTDGVGTSEE
ncbi:related to regulatory protein cys-3 [Ramularia collo-cygni]|uniref:Related to regulatory protein cys-3 n=1 Tax=Ramularia collo-cygni TaxID=112498 RepID=A0A2D3VEY5_9PEZI|nr:related to regulatory protein cys-3 [Ramularia collo-cygni]CZT20329.1 related to regulatory protein cys-3 [Ramularia collo-cygni]